MKKYFPFFLVILFLSCPRVTFDPVYFSKHYLQNNTNQTIYYTINILAENVQNFPLSSSITVGEKKQIFYLEEIAAYDFGFSKMMVYRDANNTELIYSQDPIDRSSWNFTIEDQIGLFTYTITE